MNILDMVGLGFNNLRQRKLRTFLTTLGVIVGIGALSSMVSFGIGLQKKIMDTINDNDMFTSMRVTAKKIDLNNPTTTLDSLVPISDSILEKIKQIEELSVVYPDMLFPGKILYKDKERTTQITGMPSKMGEYKPFSSLMAGKFYNSDSVPEAIIGQHTLRQMGILIKEDVDAKQMDTTKFGKDFVILPTDSIIGSIIKIKTAVIDTKAFSFNILGLQSNSLPMKDTITEVRISGIVNAGNSFSGNFMRSGLVLPYQFAKSIPKMDINNTIDFLNSNKKDVYPSIYARSDNMVDLEKAKQKIKAMGLNVFSLSDELEEIKKNFLIFDAMLGAIGLIALFVASLGIVNTMVMSILERTREIGVMKSIGASNGEIRLIFFVEASVIGFLGGLFGLIVGWLVTRLANVIMNNQVVPLGEAPVDLFHFPIWLIFGSLLFSIIVSLLAGVYPAARASKIDPVKALRHD